MVLCFMFNLSETTQYQQAEWGPLRHVRVIKERNSGISRGFAFIDFPSVVRINLNLANDNSYVFLYVFSQS